MCSAKLRCPADSGTADKQLAGYFLQLQREWGVFKPSRAIKIVDILYSLVPARLVHLHPFAGTIGNITRQRFLSQVLVRENAYLLTGRLDFTVPAPGFPPLSGLKPHFSAWQYSLVWFQTFTFAVACKKSAKAWKVLYGTAVCTYINEICILGRVLVVELAKDICVWVRWGWTFTSISGHLCLSSWITNSLLCIS